MRERPWYARRVNARSSLIAILLSASVAGAQQRPSLDGFYERGRSRTEGFEQCVGFCDGERVLQVLVGGQVANPSTDALRPALAEGPRLGLDAGMFFDAYSLARTQAWADLLFVNDTGDEIVDLVSKTTGFFATGAESALHLAADVVFAARTELEPEDFRELQRRPYRVLDVEVEAAGVGPLIDKEAALTVPVGFAQRVRWSTAGDQVETRRSWSGAVAARAFQKQKRHHYQLDFARLTRLDWTAPAGDASAWRVSAGYQRLSPDIDFMQIWLLVGWGWFDGKNDPNGFLARLGVEFDVEVAQFGTRYDAELTLDRAERLFRRVHHFQFFSRTSHFAPWRLGLTYEAIAVDDTGTLHALTPELAVTPSWALGFELGVRYRLSVLRDERVESHLDDDRFNLALDFLF